MCVGGVHMYVSCLMCVCHHICLMCVCVRARACVVVVVVEGVYVCHICLMCVVCGGVDGH